MYQGITKEKINEINKIKNKEEKKQLEKELEEEINRGKEKWQKRKKELEQLLNERKKFVITQTFYPREYAKDMSLMEVYIDRIKDYIEKDPLKIDQKIENWIESQKGLTSQFIKIKKNVEELLPKLKKYEDKLTNTEKQNYLLKKHELYMYLQRGEIEKAKQLVRYFRSKAKKA